MAYGRQPIENRGGGASPGYISIATENSKAIKEAPKFSTVHVVEEGGIKALRCDVCSRRSTEVKSRGAHRHCFYCNSRFTNWTPALENQFKLNK